MVDPFLSLPPFLVQRSYTACTRSSWGLSQVEFLKVGFSSNFSARKVIMDSFIWAFYGSTNGCEFDHEAVSAYSDPNVVKAFKLKDISLDYDDVDLPLTSNVPDPVIPSEDLSKKLDRDSAEANDISDDVLRYINKVLMEDDLEDMACTIQDSTFHAAEKSFYEVLNVKYPYSPTQPLPHEDPSTCADDSTTCCCSNCCSRCINTNKLVESGIISDLDKYVTSHVHNLAVCAEGLHKDEGDLPVPDSFLRGRNILHQEENDMEEGRSNKHLAVYAEESILHEMFDKVLSLYGKNKKSALNTGDGALPNGASRESQQSEQAKGSNCVMTNTRKGVIKKKALALRSLLIECMQSVVGNDHRSASKLLKRIRLHSSPLGDGSQRLAHYFANSLEARLAGAGSLEHKAPADMSVDSAGVLKAYKLYLSALPFVLEISYLFANKMIMELAEKATNLHIIHFGIVYGLQWAPLIQSLSTRPGGPPKLRITGIDKPQTGFRPATRVEETGRRLANYCERFNVPFEYNGIAQNWGIVSVEDLKIDKEEVLVVNCLYHFQYLLDDTILEHSPRDAVLNLIKRINPDIFIHGVTNGTYNSPFFASRFREALFHFSALFDMLEVNVPRENHERMVFERDVWGSEILNVIACEGLERVVRPETYKQWQIRTLRAGFRQLSLNQEIMKEVRAKVKSCYHKDFFVDEANQWMLEGWKGRVIYALSCWKPA